MAQQLGLDEHWMVGGPAADRFARAPAGGCHRIQRGRSNLGRTVIAASADVTGAMSYAFVYREPARGWAGKLAPVATIAYPSFIGMFGPSLATSGATSVIATSYPGGFVEHECPCYVSLFAVSDPGAAWAGRVRTAAPLSLGPGANALSLDTLPFDGSTLLLGSDGGIHVLAAEHPATIRRLTLTRLSSAAPRLSLRLEAGAGAPSLRRAVLMLPRELIVEGRHGIVVDGHPMAAVSRIGAAGIAIALKRPVRVLALTVGSGSIATSRGLRRQLRARGRHLRIRVRVVVFDAQGQSTRATVTVAIRRASSASDARAPAGPRALGDPCPVSGPLKESSYETADRRWSRDTRAPRRLWRSER
jgi:hypothetical protein